MQHKNSTYSDIHTFANAVARVEKFLKREKREKKRYYEPTRMLYLKLAQKLEECAKLAYQLAGKQSRADAVNCKPVERKVTVEPVKEVITVPDNAEPLSLVFNDPEISNTHGTTATVEGHNGRNLLEKDILNLACAFPSG